jgi:nucleotide-binding universal stress UspA family protein
MFDPSHVLTGTDFSEASQGAVREALRLVAGDPARKVTVLHVADDIQQAAALRQRVLDWCRALPEAAALQPHQLQADLELGKVADAIARCALRLGVTLIVVGPRPRGFVETWITGGVAEQLFHKARVPVLATRQPATGGYRQVLLPLDLTAGSAAALQIGAGIVRDPSGVVHADARLHLLHVAARPAGVAGKRELEDPIRDDAYAQLKKLAEGGKIAERVESYTAALGVLHDVIPRQIAALHVDLICMITRHSGSLMGSAVDAVLRNTDTPLLVAWPPAPATGEGAAQ